MKVARYFDDLYRSADHYWWRAESRYSIDPADHHDSLVTQQLLRLLDGRGRGRALDLGAGEGADAIRLALMGYDVDAVEVSQVGAEKIRRFADEVGVTVRVLNVDAADLSPSAPYDVIICNGLLHYVRDKEPILRLMQDTTVPGGYNAVQLWSTYTPVPAGHRVVDAYCDDEDGIVARTYKDWNHELFYLDRDKLDWHPNVGFHRHSHIKLIAQRTYDT